MSTPECLKAELRFKQFTTDRNAVISDHTPYDPLNAPLNVRTGQLNADNLGRNFHSKRLPAMRVMPLPGGVRRAPAEEPALPVEEDQERLEYIRMSNEHRDRAAKTLGFNLSGISNWRTEYVRQFDAPSARMAAHQKAHAEITGAPHQLSAAFALGYGTRNRAYTSYLLTCNKSQEEDQAPTPYQASSGSSMTGIPALQGSASPGGFAAGSAAGDMPAALTKSRTVTTSALLRWPQPQLHNERYPSFQ